MYIEWRLIGDDKYQVSCTGLVYSNISYKILKPSVSNNGYQRVVLSFDGKKHYINMHRLVAETFLPNPDNLPQVNHKNGNKLDNNVSNLEWCTAKHNKQHAHDTGLAKGVRGSRSNLAKLTTEQAIEIITLNKEGVSNPDIAKRFGITTNSVYRIYSGKRWPDLDEYRLPKWRRRHENKRIKSITN